jgi:hypothetical protein
MKNQWMILALLLGGLFLLRNRPMAQPSDLGVIGYTGGEGTGYGIDVWGDEG